jgi:hypothetical protein
VFPADVAKGLFRVFWCTTPSSRNRKKEILASIHTR